MNVTEEPPTGDQLRTIIEYTGDRKAGQIVDGARDASDAISKMAQDIKTFKAPVVSAYPTFWWPGGDVDKSQTVDWNNGKAGGLS